MSKATIPASFLPGLVAILLCTSAAAEDVRAYCASVGNDDRVQPLPGGLMTVARRMFELPAEMNDQAVQATTSVRCMDGSVWLCSYGANLVCDKADVSRASPGAARFCRQNPGSTAVPMSATGHATIYDWTCVGREARVAGQNVKVDTRGFIAGNWKPLP